MIFLDILIDFILKTFLAIMVGCSAIQLGVYLYLCITETKDIISYTAMYVGVSVLTLGALVATRFLVHFHQAMAF